MDAAKAYYILRVCRGLVLSSYTIFVYDYILSFSTEIALVWPAKGGPIKNLFLVQRYMALIFGGMCIFAYMGFKGMDTSSGVDFCRFTIVLQNISLIPSATVSNGIIMLRVTSLWRRRRKILISTAFIMGFTTVSSLVLMLAFHLPRVLRAYNEPRTEAEMEFPQLCTINYPDVYEIIAFVFLCVFDIYAFTVIILNDLRRPRTPGSSRLWDLHEDGLFYFIALSGIRALNLAVSLTYIAPLAQAGNLMSWSLCVTLMNRFILGTREAARTLSSSTTNCSSSPPMATLSINPDDIQIDHLDHDDSDHTPVKDVEMSPGHVSYTEDSHANGMESIGRSSRTYVIQEESDVETHELREITFYSGHEVAGLYNNYSDPLP